MQLSPLSHVSDFCNSKTFFLHCILFVLFGPNNWNKARNWFPCKLFGHHRYHQTTSWIDLERGNKKFICFAVSDFKKLLVSTLYMWAKLFFSFGTISAFWHNSKVHRNNYLKFNRNFSQVSESVRRSPDNFDPFGNNFGRAYLVSAMWIY